MLRDEDNKYCCDCDAKSPRWASWNLGIFLCIRCAGIHRNLGESSFHLLNSKPLVIGKVKKLIKIFSYIFLRCAYFTCEIC